MLILVSAGQTEGGNTGALRSRAGRKVVKQRSETGASSRIVGEQLFAYE